MAKSTEENFDDSIRFIVGGINGLVKIISSYFKIFNTTKLKRQILKGNDLSFNLEDFEVMELAEIVNYVASNKYDYNNINSFFSGNIDFFDSRSKVDKCIDYIEKSNLMDYEKKELIGEFESFHLNIDLRETISDLFENFEENTNQIIDFILDVSYEREYRIRKLRKLIDSLDIATDHNKEVINSVNL